MISDEQNDSNQDIGQESIENAEENSAMRAAKMNSDPQRSLEAAGNAAVGKAPNAAGGSASNTAEEHVPSNSEPEATDLPTAR